MRDCLANGYIVLTIALLHGMKINVEGEPIYVISHRALDKAGQQFSQGDFEAALREGRMLTLESAIALATKSEADSSPPKSESVIQ